MSSNLLDVIQHPSWFFFLKNLANPRLIGKQKIDLYILKITAIINILVNRENGAKLAHACHYDDLFLVLLNNKKH